MTSPSETIAKAMEGVTHGEWYLAGKLTIRHTSPVGGADGWIGKVNWRNGEANAAYISACNPVAMREVLDELYALREAAPQLEAVKREMAEKDERIAALEAGLKPFATHQTADGLSGPGSLLHIPDDHPLLFNGLGNDLRVTVTVGDFRRARTLIQGEKK